VKVRASPEIAVLLGYAGALPFILAVLLVMVPGDHHSVVRTSLLLYSLAIVSFLAGSWWGIALLRRQPAILVASNVLVVTAWLGAWLLHPAPALLCLAGVLIATVLVERRHRVFTSQPAYYRGLRLKLTVISVLALVLVYLIA